MKISIVNVNPSKDLYIAEIVVDTLDASACNDTNYVGLADKRS